MMRLRTRIQLSMAVVLLVLITANTSIYFIFKNSVITSEMNRLTNKTVNTLKELNTHSNLSMEQVLQAYLISNGMIRVVNSGHNPIIQVTTSNDYLNIPSKYDDDQFEEVVQIKVSRMWVFSSLRLMKMEPLSICKLLRMSMLYLVT